MNSKRLLCFLLGAALILQTPATAYAAETLTYEQYRGGSGYSSTIKEQDYAVIEISTEEDLRKLVENCVLDSWSRDKKVVLQNDIVLSMTGELSIPTFAGIYYFQCETDRRRFGSGIVPLCAGGSKSSQPYGHGGSISLWKSGSGRRYRRCELWQH